MKPEELSLLLEKVNKSGFPLQMGIADLVKKSNPQMRPDGWLVRYQEHAWRHAKAGANGYIDLVLHHKERNLILCIECKRDLNGLWIFLIDREAQKSRRQAKYWASTVWPAKPGNSITYAGYGEDVPSSPSSLESQFCVVTKNDKKDNNNRFTLEDLASEISLSTESLAYEEMPLEPESSTWLYASVIVTTAALKCCKIQSDQLSLSDGSIPIIAAEGFDVDVVRFRKQLSTHEESHTKGHYELARAKERTVWIVTAESFLGFLDDLEPDHRN